MKIYLYCLLSLLGNRLYAQQNVESDIKEIKELYRQAQEFVKQDMEDPTIEYHLTLSLQRLYPIGGPQTQQYDFYFDWKKDKEENLLPRLKFIRMKSKTGGLYNEEYLFNDKEELIFYFSKFNYFVDMENENVEMRLYYKNGNRIRNLLKTTAHENKKITDHTTILEDYKPIAEQVPKEAQRLKSLFEKAMDTSLWEFLIN